jgi:hypothetical protein
MNTRMHVAEILIKLQTVPFLFTIEMHDGTKHAAGFSGMDRCWSGFDQLTDTKLITENGMIGIDLYQVKDIY